MTPTTNCDPRTHSSREVLYRFFSAALKPPVETFALLRDESTLAAVREAADELRKKALDDAIPLGLGERPAEELDLAATTVWWEVSPDELSAEYDRVFGIGVGELPPYETEFAPNREPFARAQQMADVAGFYRAFGLTVTRDRPDALPLELEFMAFLLTKERVASETEHKAVCRVAQRDFIRDHLAWWVPSYAAGLANKAGTGPFASLARALAAYLPTERNRFGLKAPAAPARAQSVPAEEPAGCAGCPSAAV